MMKAILLAGAVALAAPAVAQVNANDGTMGQTKPGAADPELFAERIPYAETRDYVRIVLRSRDLYRALYPEVLAAR